MSDTPQLSPMSVALVVYARQTGTDDMVAIMLAGAYLACDVLLIEPELLPMMHHELRALQGEAGMTKGIIGHEFLALLRRIADRVEVPA